jgi:lysozyme
VKVGARGLDLIKSFEKCRLVGYLPTKDDVPTIGWGHTGPEVRVGMVWTQAQADEALVKDIERVERAVEGCITVPLTQQEFDACVSLAYNIGTGAFKASTLARMLNDSNYDGAAEQFLRWNKQAGQVLAGLTRRREEERELFEATA